MPSRALLADSSEAPFKMDKLQQDFQFLKSESYMLKACQRNALTKQNIEKQAGKLILKKCIYCDLTFRTKRKKEKKVHMDI